MAMAAHTSASCRSQFGYNFVVIVFLYIFAIFSMLDTNYFKEDTVIVLVHALEEFAVAGVRPNEDTSLVVTWVRWMTVKLG